MSPNSIVRLHDILANAQLAQEFLGILTADELANDVLRLYALTRAVEIVGEAAANVDAADKATAPALPWRQMIDIQNRLIHGYQTVRPLVLHDTIRNHFPTLIEQIELILKESLDANGR